VIQPFGHCVPLRAFPPKNFLWSQGASAKMSSKHEDSLSSPFKTPPTRKSLIDAGEIESPRKRSRVNTPPQVRQESSPAPQPTPRTAARYGLPHDEVSKISKKASNFKELMSVMTEMMVWGIENPDFTDQELGVQVMKAFRNSNVSSRPMSELILSLREESIQR
jgi:hypothetical protein